MVGGATGSGARLRHDIHAGNVGAVWFLPRSLRGFAHRISVRQRRSPRFARGMGFFDRFAGKKTTPATSAAPAPAAVAAEAPPVAPAIAPATPAAPAPVSDVVPRLAAARAKLEALDLPGALAIYEELLAVAGERADVLVTISGDLGARGHVASIIELVAPRYDADRHGPATGINLLQAYLVTRNPDAAQHVLDILFALNRPELEMRLHGFSNAIAEMINERHAPLDPGAVGQVAEVPKVGLITISKPIWSYGLEAMAAQLLPAKEGRLRKIAFAQLAVPGAYADVGAAMAQPEDELGRLSRALPVWLAETFYFSTAYAPVAAVGVMTRPGLAAQPMIFGAEWSVENLRQLVETSDGIDYIFTGALKKTGEDFEVLLRVWEVKKMKERKTFSAKWTRATADTELAKLHEQIRVFMEWKPVSVGLPYAVPAQPRAWLDTLGASLAAFLVEKAILPKETIATSDAMLAAEAPRAAATETASLAWLTLRARLAKAVGANAPEGVVLADSAVVAQAAEALG